MSDFRSYVVRVYRQQGDAVHGTVQEVRSGRNVPFCSMEELWYAIGAASRRSATPSPEPQPAPGPDTG